jgi:peptidoglycan/LPS O-acetylase OafA/YrhL
MLGSQGGDLPWLTVGSNFLLVQAWGIANTLDGPGWSVSTEMAAYLLFPLLAIGILYGRWRIAGLGVVLCIAALVVVATRTDSDIGVTSRSGPFDVHGENTLYPVVRCLAGFTLGVFSYRLTNSPAWRRLLAWPNFGDILLIAVLALLLVRNSDLAIEVLLVALIAALATERSFAAKLLATPVCYWLGSISYSIYLVQGPMLDYVGPRTTLLLRGLHVPHPFLVGVALLIPTVFVISALTFYFVERPGRELSRALINRLPGIMPTAVRPVAVPER